MPAETPFPRPKMASEQEELMRTLAERSMGAPFVFVPDKWYKPRGEEREAADLAWVCNGCAVLMYLKKKVRSGRPDRATFDRLTESNFIQARGWLRAWRANMSTLRGANAYRSFDMACDGCEHLVILSIVDCDGAQFQEYPDLARDLGVRVCVSLPYSFMEALGKMGGSMLDLLAGVQESRKVGLALPEHLALRVVRDYQRESWRASGAAKVWVRKDEPRFVYAATLMLGLRQLFAAPTGVDTSIPLPEDVLAQLPAARETMASVCNDLGLVDHLKLVVALGEGIDVIVKQSKPLGVQVVQVAMGVFPLIHYDIVLCFARQHRLLDALPSLNKAKEEHSRHGPDYPCPTILFDCDSGVLFGSAYTAWPSATSMLLERMRAGA